MRTLILHPTELSQWHAIVNEAQANAKLVLNEETESYLVYLLMRFSHATKLMESIIGLDFLDSLHKPSLLQKTLLQEVGDKSLLFCGLFPGIAQKRNVSLSYFSDMGQAAYLTVSQLHDPQSRNLYIQLSHQFLSLQTILQAMRGETLHNLGLLSTINLSMQ